MKNNLKSICALMLSITVLATTLTACGKKIERKNVNSDEYIDNQNGVILANGDTDGSVQDDSGNIASDSGNYDSVDYGGSSGGSYSGGSYSSGSSSSGNSSSGSSQSSSEEPTASVSSDSGSTTTTKKASIFDRFKKTTTTTKKTTTTTTAKTTRTPTHIPVDAEKVLNSAPLTPMKTNDSQVDAKVDALLSSIITSNMSTYDKVVAIYDNLVQQSRYGYMPIRSTDSTYVSVYDADVVARAKNFLTYRTGICVDFSAAFMVLTRRIGLNCYLISGQIIDKYGNSTFHGWNVIRINGVDYGFDPESDFRSSDGGETKFWVFCVNDPVKFDKTLTNAAVTTFKNFKTF